MGLIVTGPEIEFHTTTYSFTHYLPLPYVTSCNVFKSGH